MRSQAVHIFLSNSNFWTKINTIPYNTMLDSLLNCWGFVSAHYLSIFTAGNRYDKNQLWFYHPVLLFLLLLFISMIAIVDISDQA